MLKKLLLLLILGWTSSLWAGEGYELINPPQPVQNPDKVEVMEFFWYGCPHCYAFEPSVAAWLKNKPANVAFIRQPAVFSDLWGKHAKAYFVAEALGIEDKTHADFFDAIQNKKQKLSSEEELGAFFAAHGVKADDFHAAYNSFMVDTKLRQAEGMGSRYGVTGVPTIIVNGKYRVSGSTAGSQENIFKVVDELIKQESAHK
jgi:protein dithiol oxidoreductase (disulfide-forming)